MQRACPTLHIRLSFKKIQKQTEELDIYLSFDIAVACFGRTIQILKRSGNREPLGDLIVEASSLCTFEVLNMMRVVEKVRGPKTGHKYFEQVFEDQIYKKVERWLKTNK